MTAAIRTRLERVAVMVRKELRQMLRDPRMRRVIFISPIVQLVVFGYAVQTDIRNTPTFVVDLDHTRASRQLLEALVASGRFEIVGTSDDTHDIDSALDHARAIVGIEIPVGFGRDLAAGGARVQVVLDGSQSNTATIARGYAERIVLAYGARAGVAVRPPLELHERAWFNPDLASRNYNVPAIAGAILMLVCLLLTALAVVREREIGTLEQLMVSPLQPAELIAGKTLPFALVGLFDLALVTAVAVLWFRVPFAGSVLFYLAASALYILSGLGLGLLISTISSTQQEAFMATFLLFMPTMLLSGFLFPLDSMPRVFQWMTLGNPLRHYLEIVRGIFLKGTGIEVLWPQVLALAVLGATLLTVAASRFRKRLG
jgi:ABC-2 type transport system permease protein